MQSLNDLARRIRDGATDEVLREAVERFRELPPEEQAQMFERQREGWSRSCQQGRGERQAVAILPQDPRVAAALRTLRQIDSPPEYAQGEEYATFLETLIRSAILTLSTEAA